jgi:GTP cyclohydrolase I
VKNDDARDNPRGMSDEDRRLWAEYNRRAVPSVGEAREAVATLLRYIEKPPSDGIRDGLLDTPARVVKSYKELFGGYGCDVAKILKTFDGEKYSGIVLLQDVEMYSTCEHHLMPFVGKAHVAYIPKGDRVVGLSKLARLVEAFSRRLQIQERLTDEIADALMTHLKPLGAAVRIEAKHFCMCARGVNKQHSVMKTTSLRGCFKTEPTTAAEFYQLLGT